MIQNVPVKQDCFYNIPRDIFSRISVDLLDHKLQVIESIYFISKSLLSTLEMYHIVSMVGEWLVATPEEEKRKGQILQDVLKKGVTIELRDFHQNIIKTIQINEQDNFLKRDHVTIVPRDRFTKMSTDLQDSRLSKISAIHFLSLRGLSESKESEMTTLLGKWLVSPDGDLITNQELKNALKMGLSIELFDLKNKKITRIEYNSFDLG